MVGLVVDAHEPMLEEFAQCVVMLYAYTILPTGKLPREHLATRQHVLRGDAASEAVAGIMRGPWLTPRAAYKGKSQ